MKRILDLYAKDIFLFNWKFNTRSKIIYNQLNIRLFDWIAPTGYLTGYKISQKLGYPISGYVVESLTCVFLIARHIIHIHGDLFHFYVNLGSIDRIDFINRFTTIMKAINTCTSINYTIFLIICNIFFITIQMFENVHCWNKQYMFDSALKIGLCDFILCKNFTL